MKKFGTIIGALLLCVCFLLTGCGPNLEMPTGEVKSNGGHTIVVGDYVYFANTYVTTSSLSTGDNDQGKVGYNAIYRVKTKDGLTTRDEDGNLENVEQVMSKIAGFETSNMFAVGNYLYFTSPNTRKSSIKEEAGKDRFDLTTLFRCKLDGTGLKEILTTQTTSGKFYLAKNAGKDVLYFFDDGKIQQLEIKDNLSKQTTLVSDVSDVVFPKDFGKEITELYYTVALTEDDGTNEGVTGNKLYRLTLSNGEKTLLRQRASETISLVAYDTNRLFYTRNEGQVTAYYSNKFEAGKGFEVNEKQHTFVSDASQVTQFYSFGVDENGNLLPVIYVFNSKLYIQPATENYSIMEDESVTVEFISDEYVYYTTSTGIYRKSYKTPTKAAVQITDQGNVQAGSVDFDGRFVYFFAPNEINNTDSKYMYRANTKTAELGRMETEIIASVDVSDMTESSEAE